MSDDEIYAGSPYEDYDDYYDDETALDLADDLAQHAAHSPVWQDTPYGELDPYYSDWEYYSDDYYDDDPKLLAQNTIDGCVSKPVNKPESHQTKKGRKRKLDEAREAEIDLQTRALHNTIRGTVWAEEQSDMTAIYRMGDQEKVSLLTNWRDLFGLQDRPVLKSTPSHLHRDESWANEMGLADMGLHNELERREVPGPAIDEDDRHSIGNEDDLATSDDAVDTIDTAHLQSDSASDRSSITSAVEDSEVSQQTKIFVRSGTSTMSGNDTENQESPPKKRRKMQTTSPPPIVNGSKIDQAVNNVYDTDADAEKGSVKQMESKPISQSKKRKLSGADEAIDTKRKPPNKRLRARQTASSSLKSTADESSNKDNAPPRRSHRLKGGAG